VSEPESIAAALAFNRGKVVKSIASVDASLQGYAVFDAACEYSPKELEPDAFADRFVRAVECSLRYMRSLEMAQFAEQSESTRSLLDRIEKLGVVSSAGLWMQMRNIRNRIVHDYLPQQVADMFELLARKFAPELLRLQAKL
jgi:uncharacterized protein YutE (UPF0331/DUF86 family)